MILILGVITGSVRGADELSSSIGLKLRLIPAGTFMMGFDQHRQGYSEHFNEHAQYDTRDESPLHPVRLTKPFYLGKTEVTVGEFGKFVEETGYRTTAERSGKGILGVEPDAGGDRARWLKQLFEQKPEFTWRNPGFKQSDTEPVVGVSREDAQAFCLWLSRKDGATYRLPTEAEWEYACRAGTDTWFNWGDDYRGVIHGRANVANVELEKAIPDRVISQWLFDVETATGDGFVYTAPVGRFPPNRWGLHDMHGNVWELCADKYVDTFYKQWGRKRFDRPPESAVDPRNEENWNEHGDWRVIRGGAWNVSPLFNRSSIRGWYEASAGAAYLGFRVVRDAESAAVAEAVRAFEREQAAVAAMKAAGGDVRSADQNYMKVHFDPIPSSEVLRGLKLIPGLREVEFRCRRKLTPEVIRELVQIPDLRRIFLSDCGEGVSDEDFAPLARVTALHTVEVVDTHHLSDAILRHFGGLTNLTKLRISGREISDGGLEMLGRLKQLRKLDVQGTPATGEFLAAMKGIPLEVLHMAELNDAGAALVGEFKGLRRFSLSRGTALTDLGFAHFKNLKRLEDLTLQRVKGITDAGFAPLAALARLRSLEIRETQAGDLAARAISELPRLSNLGLGSEFLTDAGLESLGAIVSLDTLAIASQAVNVTDRGLTYLWRLNRLGRLFLDGDTFSAKGLEPLAELANLRQVRARGIGVKADELAYLKTIMPKTRFEFR